MCLLGMFPCVGSCSSAFFPPPLLQPSHSLHNISFPSLNFARWLINESSPLYLPLLFTFSSVSTACSNHYRFVSFLHLPLCHFFDLLVSLTMLSFLIRLLYLFICVLGCCPRAGHLAAAAFAPLLDLRCCHCLAGPRLGNSSRFPCCLCFAKPRYTERNLRWLQRFTFQRFHTL